MATITKQLTVQQAEVTTASIEIKALTLNRKQVTLSAFRQLIEEDLVLDDGTLAGVPWGFVNYHPDRCGDDRDHWHVVWQDGNELRRSLVYRSINFGAFETADVDLFIRSCVYEQIMGRLEYFNGDIISGLERVYRRSENVHAFVKSFGLKGSEVQLRGVVPAELAKAVAECATEAGRAEKWLADATASLEKDPEEPYAQRRVDSAVSSLRSRVGLLADHLIPAEQNYQESADTVLSRLEEAVRDEECRRNRHVRTRAAISELTQLFIAV